MRATQVPEGIYKIPDTLAGELDKLRDMALQVKDGTLSGERFRAFRVPQGVYEQRDVGTFMLRVRCAGGVTLPHQMKTLADVSEKYGDGTLHVTTRQDIQIHKVALENIYPALVALYEAGLSTKGGGGNTVRNITACHHSGVCPDEEFDVTPYAVAVTDFMLVDPHSYELPRKYKIAFSGCSRDCAGATVNDVGLIAKRRDGVDGFAVYAAGGMGIKSRTADFLEEFVPASGIHLVAEAIKRLFDKRGNRKNKHKARLRFLMEEMGLDAFRGLYQKELKILRDDSPASLQLRPLPRREPSPAGGPVESAAPGGFEDWRRHNVLPQKQEGRFITGIPLSLGDIEAGTMRALADIVTAHGEGVLRTTQDQNIALRWISGNELADLYSKLDGIGLAGNKPPILSNLIVCAGAATCKLGICLSRGLAGAVERKLSRNGSDLEKVGELGINISGCPNSCGRHPVGHIGLFGAARRVEGKLVPCYVIQLGGRVEEGKTELASGSDSVPARNIPDYLKDFLEAYAASSHCSDFYKFLDAEGRQKAKELALKYKEVPSFADDKNFYYDWDAQDIFSLAGRGPGECGAGVFDLIEVDLASARGALEEKKCYAATVLASRALLVTRGEQADDDISALTLFKKYFADRNLISGELKELIDRGIECASKQNPEDVFDAEPDKVKDLIDAVADLYENMDDSLRFKSEDEPAPEKEPAAASSSGGAAEADVSRDFRGVVCPLNYVKTKLVLEQMDSGKTLSILLDEEGARNVPASAAEDGHEILSTTREDNHWRIIIRKG